MQEQNRGKMRKPVRKAVNARGKNRKTPRDRAGRHDTTFRELVVWLIRRHRLRRRYQTDDRKKTVHRQLAASLLFLAVLTLLLSVSMTYVRLHTQERQHVIRTVSDNTEVIRNPALETGEVTCAVTVQIGAGEAFVWNTIAMTVGDMLTDVGYLYSEDDILNVPADTIVEEGMHVTVVCVTYEESTEIVSVPYGTVYEDVQTIPRGTTERISYGVNGVARETRRSRYENGVPVSNEVLSSETVTSPVDEVLRRGVGGVVYGDAGAYRYSYYIDCTATAYGGYEETRYTYSGTVAREGVIAVDPDVIPLGTKVYVKGSYGDYGVCSADDIGSGIKGNHIDIYMDASLEVMMEFGFRNMRVYILEE